MEALYRQVIAYQQINPSPRDHNFGYLRNPVYAIAHNNLAAILKQVSWMMMMTMRMMMIMMIMMIMMMLKKKEKKRSNRK